LQVLLFLLQKKHTKKEKVGERYIKSQASGKRLKQRRKKKERKREVTGSHQSHADAYFTI
jgi:hypothetical protein